MGHLGLAVYGGLMFFVSMWCREEEEEEEEEE